MKLKPYIRKKGHDIKEFNSNVSYYKKNLVNILNTLNLKHNGKRRLSSLVIFNATNECSFFSVAPLSKALSSFNIDVSAKGVNLAEKSIFNHICNSSLKPIFSSFILKEGLYEINHPKKNNEANELFEEFLYEIEKTSDKKLSNHTKDIFSHPDIIIIGYNNRFTVYNTKVFIKTLAGYMFEKRLTLKQELVIGSLEYKYNWAKKYRIKELEDTCDIIWNQVFNLKKKEKVGISFDLIDDKLTLPIDDLLDSYIIAFAMKKALEKHTTDIGFASDSTRRTMLEPITRLGDLSATLSGCELSKDFKEPVFVAFKKLSKILDTKLLRFNSAVFAINGDGYPGKHLFGEAIGYPTTSGVSRWQSAGQILYKLPYYPQTMHDKRKPMARVGFTSTIPLDLFINSCNINWLDLQNRNKVIKDILLKCDYVKVEGNEKNTCNFLVHLNKNNSKEKRMIKTSDIAVKELINNDFYKKTGIYAGNMNNIPAGETFVTPEYIEGHIVGDVVINVGKSYPLIDKKPLIIDSNKNGYKIISGPNDILRKINENKSDAMKRLNLMEKNPNTKELAILKKSNFEKIGEFAINTNPKAELCDYLIVNEKLANMMHVALGSGFEADRSSEYHYDIVINSIKQKLTVYGVTEKGERINILVEGQFVI